MSSVLPSDAPSGWALERFGYIARRSKEAGRPDLEPLSVFLDEGVVPRAAREDNFNRLGADLSNYLVVKPGDLVFNKLRTWQGGLGVSSHTGIVSPAYFVCRPTCRVDSRYYHYLLRSQLYLAELTRVSKFMPPSQFDIAWEDLRDLPVFVPPRAEQRAIADYLDTETARIDALIAKKRRMIELLDERFTVHARKMLTGQPSEAMWTTGPHWLGPVPLNWRPEKIAWRKVTASGTTPESGNERYYDDDAATPWVTTAELRESVILAADRRVTQAALAEHSALTVFPTGTVLIAMYGATVGRLGVLGVPAATNQACCAMYGGRGLDQQFLYWWLLAHREHIVEMAYGSGQPNISQETVRGLRVPAPEESEQRAIVSALSSESNRVEAAKKLLHQQIGLFVEHRQALITAAVTGELEIPVAA